MEATIAISDRSRMSKKEKEAEESRMYFIKKREDLGAKKSQARIKCFKEEEEATYIKIAILLRPNYLFRCLIMPILSIVTIFVFPLMIYWDKEL